MPKTFTNQNQLLALLYNELTLSNKVDLMQQVSESLTLTQELNELTETISLLSAAELEPDPTSLSIIMEYSLKTQAFLHV
jgi:hypothetical protein